MRKRFDTIAIIHRVVCKGSQTADTRIVASNPTTIAQTAFIFKQAWPKKKENEIKKRINQPPINQLKSLF